MDDAVRLGINAALVQRLLDQVDGRIVARWRLPAFGRSVDAVRRQLAPIRDRATLGASYGREAGRARWPRADQWMIAGASAALEVAYAVRWMEIEHGRPAQPFASIVAAVPVRSRPNPSVIGRSSVVLRRP